MNVARSIYDLVCSQVAAYEVETRLGKTVSAYIIDYLESLNINISAHDEQAWKGFIAELIPDVTKLLADQIVPQLNAYVIDNPEFRSQFFSFAWYGNIGDYGWLAFYEYFTRIGIVNNADFNRYCTMMKNHIYDMAQFDTVCIVCEKPQFIHRNDDGRMHALTTAAVAWKDGYELFFVNGREVDGTLIKDPKQITKDRFLNERNSDLRGAMYEILGQQGMCDLMGAVETARAEKNGETYILYSTQEKDSDIGDVMKWVGVQCPSTSTKYMLGVEPHHTDPVEAVASTFGVTGEEYVLTQNT